MGTKNKQLEKLTKAELIAHVQRMTHEVNVLESEKERIKEEYNKLATDLAGAVERNDGLLTRVDSLIEGQRTRDGQLHKLKTELAECEESRARAERNYNEAEERATKTRKLLIRQAHLAGELATMTGNVDLMVTRY